ncbi:MAG TPA: hypothetical protein VFG51_00155 [Candidatus Saccharimonadia bacterium]|nr:hypothetical protein [Candidatus Saccharimonadia bacterium]
MCEYCGFNNKLFWPLTLIFVGVLVMMLNIGVLPAAAWRLWPAIPVVIGLVGLSATCDNCRVETKRKSSKKRR